MKCRIDLNYNFEKIGLPENIIMKLNENKIYLIEDIWKLKRNQLKNMNFTNDEINMIIIKLQLLGLDLNKTKY